MSPRKRPEEPKIPRTVYFPPQLHELLNKHAEQTGVAANSHIILALWAYLKDADLPAVPPPTSDDVAGFD